MRLAILNNSEQSRHLFSDRTAVRYDSAGFRQQWSIQNEWSLVWLCLPSCSFTHGQGNGSVFVKNTLVPVISNSKEQSPSWEADSHSANQEIPHLLWNPRKFITVFTRGCNWTTSWARWIQYTSLHPDLNFEAFIAVMFQIEVFIWRLVVLW